MLIVENLENTEEAKGVDYNALLPTSQTTLSIHVPVFVLIFLFSK